MKIKLKSLHIQNFKGCKDRTITFGEKTRISGANATGKTTVFDAFTWLLFGKDSLGSAKFDIRPMDKAGKMIDNVEISAEATICVDDEEYVLKKIQKQVWRKKRGTNTTEFQGNVNEFEINGYPKSEKEFKEFISGIINENIFNLVTNPNAFNALPWKDQREMLMRFVGDFSDVEIAQQFGDQFIKLIPELKIASTDDILKKYNKAKSALNKEMVEIPARIDELSKQLVTVDVEALEVEKAAKEAALKKVEDELSGGVDKLEEINGLRQQVIDSKFRMSEIQNTANEELSKKRGVARAKVDEAENEYRKLWSQLSDMESERDGYISKREFSAKEKNRLLDEWRKEKAKVFPEFQPLAPYVELEPLKESDFICSKCGQSLPEEVKKERIATHEERNRRAKADYEARSQAHKSKYEKDKADFENRKESELKRIVEAGQKSANDEKEYGKKAEEMLSKISILNDEYVQKKDECAKLRTELEKIPSVADVSENEDYREVQFDIFTLEDQIAELSKESSGKTELEAKKAVLKDEIAEIEAKIKAADNTKVNARIAELEEEQKTVGQKIAEQEQMIDLTEDFIRAKMDRISTAINDKFQIVSFRLFEDQINGGLKETCECTVDGVPFSSLNNGHRIVAGLDIIRSLSDLYGISCPVFIDNSESVNEENFPAMGAQMIHLVVTDEKELKIESEDE